MLRGSTSLWNVHCVPHDGQRVKAGGVDKAGFGKYRADLRAVVVPLAGTDDHVL
jgi:hypothetical protein